MKDFTPIQFAHPKDFPGEYGTDVPVGEFEARLDFRVDMGSGSKRCFFTHLETGEKFNIIATRSEIFGVNEPESDVNFVSDAIPVQNAFRLVTGRSKYGRIFLKSATAIPEPVAACGA